MMQAKIAAANSRHAGQKDSLMIFAGPGCIWKSGFRLRAGATAGQASAVPELIRCGKQRGPLERS